LDRERELRKDEVVIVLDMVAVDQGESGRGRGLIFKSGAKKLKRSPSVSVCPGFK
jgi:hypothetical protein